MRAWNKPEGLDAFPTRGGRCLDVWQADDVAELVEIRRRLAAFDAATERVAAEWQAERRAQERPRRQQDLAT